MSGVAERDVKFCAPLVWDMGSSGLLGVVGTLEGCVIDVMSDISGGSTSAFATSASVMGPTGASTGAGGVTV